MAIKTVFLSSTGSDLVAYREAAFAAIDGLDGFKCIRMESYGAADDAPVDVDRGKVAGCDLFVGLMGHNYGSCPPDDDKSFTEHEYDDAVEFGKPRLMFVAPDDFSTPGTLRESDEKWELQRLFRERVMAERVIAEFDSPDRLATKIVQSIHEWAPGRPAAPAIATTIPLPPNPYFAHPYAMQPNFTGRVEERRMLSGWWRDGTETVLALTAIGGMGKSALTWAWALRDVLGLPLAGAGEDPADVAAACGVAPDARPDGLLWWSFYERDAGFAAFLDAALAYGSGGAVDPDAVPSQHDKLQALLALLGERRLLIVLDGLERELGAYAGMDAAYRGDAVADDAAHRACVDPAAADFLRRAAALPLAGRVLLTSRLFPSDLEGQGGGILAGCRHEPLTELGRDDAVTFFADEGVKGTRAEIEQACLPYGRHPLTLRLLAGLIVHDPEKPGDVSVAEGYDPVPDLIPREHHVLEWSYDALDDESRALLSRIAAFRSPMDYAALAAISPFDDDDVALKGALTALRERGLLLFDATAARHDLHPIVRRHAYDRLADKDGVHARLRDYFDSVPPPDTVTRLEDLASVIELYHHTVRAGDYDAARRLYRDRLTRNLYYRLGDYQTCIDLLATLFPDGQNRPPRIEEAADQAWTFNALANAYSLSGQSRRAVPLFELQNEIQENRNEKLNLAIGLGNLANDQQRLGELAVAEQGYRQDITLCEEVENTAWEAIGHIDLGRLLVCRGAFGESGTALDRAAENFKKLGDKEGLCIVEASRAECSLIIGDINTALAAARRARRLANEVAEEKNPLVRLFIRAEWLLGAALMALAEHEPDGREGRLAEAEDHLRDALTRCRRINLVDYEPAIVLAWARWHRLKGAPEDARRGAMDALAIADRCEYRLVQADVRNFLALLALDAGDAAAAREQAGIALERAECDGKPHRYEPAYLEAERLLAEAGG